MAWYIWGAVAVVVLWLLSVAFNPPQRRRRKRYAAVKRRTQRRRLAAGQCASSGTQLFEKDVYRIAGITFHCRPSDVGGFFGTVEPQPDNPHDPDALAIYRDDGRHLGYIPAADLPRFRERFGSIDGGRLFLTGFIAVDAHAPIYGRVLVFAGDVPADDRRAQEAFVDRVTARHGKGFAPRRFEYPL